jgi:hypothetical protein
VVRTLPRGFVKRKRVGSSVIVGVIVWRGDGRGSTVKGNNGGGWSSDGVMLRLG